MFHKKQRRFIEIHTETGNGSVNTVLVDAATGVNYLYHRFGNSGGLTVMLNPDGSPVVTPLEMLYPQ